MIKKRVIDGDAVVMAVSFIFVLVFLSFLYFNESVSFSPADINDNLVASYSFSGNAVDDSSNGNDGSAVEVGFSEGKVGNSLKLSYGSKSYVKIPDSSSLNSPTQTGELSISFFVKLDSLEQPNQWTWVLLKQKGEIPTRDYSVYYQNNVRDFALMLGNGEEVQYSFTRYPNFEAGKWYHIVFTFDKDDGNAGNQQGTLKAYVNGILTSSKNNFKTNLLYDSEGDLFIGYPGKSINGELDELMIFDKALSLNEVSYLYTFLNSGGENLECTDSDFETKTVSYPVNMLSPKGYNLNYGFLVQRIYGERIQIDGQVRQKGEQFSSDLLDIFVYGIVFDKDPTLRRALIEIKTSGENNIFKKGETCLGGDCSVDSCEGGKVREYYCSNGLKTSKIVDCPTGYKCNLGACIVNSAPLTCGDGICGVGETYSNCKQDCFVENPGNGICETSDPSDSPDCFPELYCGDGICNNGEDVLTCAADCLGGTYCGDGACNGDETALSCKEDCVGLGFCGDGVCAAGESYQTCSKDCFSGESVNGELDAGIVTESGEDVSYADYNCGDGFCSLEEDSLTCPSDCVSTTTFSKFVDWIKGIFG